MLQHYPELRVKIEEYRMGLQHTTEKVARYAASIEARVESIKYKIALLEDFAAVVGENPKEALLQIHGDTTDPRREFMRRIRDSDVDALKK
jgi:hypothetical protein